MKFIETPLPGAYIVQIEQIKDERGFFGRSWCAEEFQTYGLNPCLAQCNISFNLRRGTLRGMHLQCKPHEEAKLVRCTMGAIYDVIVDLRNDSPTRLQWFGIELTAQNRTMLYIPEGLVHGFQTLADNSEVFYQMSEYYHPESAGGVRFDDPALGISWPISDMIISDKDRSLPTVPH